MSRAVHSLTPFSKVRIDREIVSDRVFPAIVVLFIERKVFSENMMEQTHIIKDKVINIIYSNFIYFLRVNYSTRKQQ
jgi:hypothetical protein